jgi:hypothetical protein
MMGSWNGAHGAFAVKAYYKNNDSYVSAQRVFRNHFNIPRNEPVPSAHAIKTWIKNANVARAEGALQRSPTHSARWHAVSLGSSDRGMKKQFTQRSPLSSV